MEKGLINIAIAVCVVGLAAVSAYLYVHDEWGAASGWALMAFIGWFFGGPRTQDPTPNL